MFRCDVIWCVVENSISDKNNSWRIWEWLGSFNPLDQKLLLKNCQIVNKVFWKKVLNENNWIFFVKLALTFRHPTTRYSSFDVYRSQKFREISIYWRTLLLIDLTKKNLLFSILNGLYCELISRNSLSDFFCKNFVKALVLLKKLLNRWFLVLHTVPLCGSYWSSNFSAKVPWNQTFRWFHLSQIWFHEIFHKCEWLLIFPWNFVSISRKKLAIAEFDSFFIF